MRILLCNERFLFRFGVDRVLMVLGRHFREMGHTVIMMGNRLDEAAIETCADRFIQLPEVPNYFQSNEYILQWLRENWNDLFGQEDAPDVALVAGWPFFCSFGFLRGKCCIAIYLDCGGVPVDNLEGGALENQLKLRQLRADNMPQATEIFAISDFIAQTQSLPETKGKVPVRVIHLGVDHMKRALWTEQNVANAAKNGIVQDIAEFKKQGVSLIMLLGRFESGNYKNSEAGYRIIRKLKKSHPAIKLMVLAKSAEMRIPDDLKDNIIPMGFLTDSDLQQAMAISDAGITVSQWEGFNLPLGEMQLLRRPVFAFNIGAHPEVVCHPYFLCSNEEEMLDKLGKQLEGKGLDAAEAEAAYDRFAARFQWSRTAREYIERFLALLMQEQTVIVDVTNACHDTANNGIMRVARHVAKNLQERMKTIFVLWDSSIDRYVFPYDGEVALLCAYGGPDPGKIDLRSREGFSRSTLDEVIGEFPPSSVTLLFTEVINAQSAWKIKNYVHSRGIKISAIFYDAIPYFYPEFVSQEVMDNHGNYMKILAEYDLVIPISEASAKALQQFWIEKKVRPALCRTDQLSAELEGITRQRHPAPAPQGKVKMLCVSTLEPRKNHIRLINGALMLEKHYPDLDWELHLVGKCYAGNDDIPNFVKAAARKNSRIVWHGVADDKKLFDLYAECSFTIYPSVVEGFGMPIIESLWNGKPCICSQDSVMGELAQEGGCLAVNVLDENAIMEAMHTLATDGELWDRLQKEALSRHIRTWQEYTLTFMDYLNDLMKDGRQNKAVDIRLASITDKLWRLDPDCAVCLGKVAIAQLLTSSCRQVFQIVHQGIDEVGENIVALQGAWAEVLPIFVEELNSSGRRLDVICTPAKLSDMDYRQLIEIIGKCKSSWPVIIIDQGE